MGRQMGQETHMTRMTAPTTNHHAPDNGALHFKEAT